jgi:predicted transporter
MFLFLQMPTDAPTSFIALNWLMTGALVAALIYVFRQWQSEKRNCTKQYLDTIKQLMEALHDKADDE